MAANSERPRPGGRPRRYDFACRPPRCVFDIGEFRLKGAGVDVKPLSLVAGVFIAAGPDQVRCFCVLSWRLFSLPLFFYFALPGVSSFSATATKMAGRSKAVQSGPLVKYLSPLETVTLIVAFCRFNSVRDKFFFS